jgi:hypothetical protein
VAIDAIHQAMAIIVDRSPCERMRVIVTETMQVIFPAAPRIQLTLNVRTRQPS